MKTAAVAKEVFVRSPGPGIGVVAATYECSSHPGDLLGIHSTISRSDTADVAYVRRSSDDGRTWTAPREWPTRWTTPHGTGRLHPRGGYLDPVSGRFIKLWTQGILPTDHPLEGMRQWVLWYSTSDDGDRTELVHEPIIHEGPGFDAEHPLPGVTTGMNGVMMGDLTCRPLTLPNGSILVPVQSSPTGPDGAYFSPGGGFTYTDALVLIGRWKPDGRLSWTTSDRVIADPARSTRGMIEPTLAILADGRILMIMRGSNDRQPHIPGHKWFSVSSDNGVSWTPPAPWRYTDGFEFHSPSACSQLVPHSSGALFWVGNLCRQNPSGNSPRYPLVMAEVDKTSGLLIRESVQAIDDRGPGEDEALTLSNFCVREDRATGTLRLHMTRFFARPSAPGAAADWTADALLYRIGVTRRPL